MTAVASNSRMQRRAKLGVLPVWRPHNQKAVRWFVSMMNPAETHMIIGNPEIFALESSITEAYERLSFRALGYFVIHIAGRSYGVKEADATMLACSFDEVGRRIAGRGSRIPPFPIDAGAEEIARAFRRALYEDCGEREEIFGMLAPQFVKAICTPRLEWAPDGDEAFDDGSNVVQVEDQERVRLVAYVSSLDGLYDPATLRDVWLSSDEFYNILQNWRDRFEAKWIAAPKMADGND
jgi:hypothetical protein